MSSKSGELGLKVVLSHIFSRIQFVKVNLVSDQEQTASNKER